jgi:hypothetical protein
MADLGEIDRALPVNIVGRNPGTGLDDNYLDVDVNGYVGSRLYTASGSSINFGQATMANSLPVTFASDQSSIKISNFPTTVDTNYGTVGASTLRTASQIGNATGGAAFGAGTTSAQVLRVVLPTDQTAIPASQSGSWTVAATQSGTWTTGRTWTLASGTDGVTAAQGTAAALSGHWPVQITDGTNTMPTADVAARAQFHKITDGTNTAAVKAASTAAVATDPALVVAISPNNTIPENLTQVGGSAITLGQKTMANSIPVVLPSDQTITVTSSPLPASGSKFSFGRTTTSASTQVPVEETTYTEQTTNAQRSLASSNAGDISGGTGARTVLITYYDQTGAGPFTESVTMAGTATANTVSTTICYIESLKVTSVGSAFSNQGTITLFTAINKGGTTITTIAVGDSQTFHAHHYVPTGKICFISGFSVGNNTSSSGAGGLFVLKASTPTVANSQELQVSDFVTIAGAASTDTRTYNSPIQVTGPARVRAYVSPYATSSTTSYASFDFIDH